MSRFRNTARSLSSGYMAMGANVLYTLASVPLALQFLSKKEFGLWALASQVAANLVLIDFGISGAATRTLIDHKDNWSDGKYGSVIKTSFVVFVVQGLLTILGGCAIAWWIPGLMKVPEEY